MTKAAKRLPTGADRVKKIDNQVTDIYNLLRQKNTTPKSFIAPTLTGRGIAPTNVGGGLKGFLKTEGDSMIGPIALFPEATTVASGKIDIGRKLDGTGAYSSRIIVNGQGSVSDDLDTINNASFAGQILNIQAVTGQTLTLKNGTGNIRTSTGSDIAVGGQDNILLVFDSTANEWTNITAVASGGGITFPIKPPINDLSDTWTGNQTIDLSATSSHVTKIILDQNLTWNTPTNPPSSGNQIEFEIEYIQDSTGGYTVTHWAELVETVTISSVADETTIVTYRTNDGGTTYHAVPALRGTIDVTGGGGSEVPVWTQNHDSDGYNLIIDQDGDSALIMSRDGNGADDQLILALGGLTRTDFGFAQGLFSVIDNTSGEALTLSKDSAKGIINTTDSLHLQVGGVEKVTINNAADSNFVIKNYALQLLETTGGEALTLSKTTTQAILNSADAYNFQVAGTSKVTINDLADSNFVIKDYALQLLETVGGEALTLSKTTTAGIINSSDKISFQIAGTSEMDLVTNQLEMNNSSITELGGITTTFSHSITPLATDLTIASASSTKLKLTSGDNIEFDADSGNRYIWTVGGSTEIANWTSSLFQFESIATVSFDFFANESSPMDNNVLWRLDVEGNSDVTGPYNYLRMEVISEDVSDATLATKFLIEAMDSTSTLSEILSFTALGGETVAGWNFNGYDLIGVDDIFFENSVSLQTDSGGLNLSVAAGDTIELKVAGNVRFQVQEDNIFSQKPHRFQLVTDGTRPTPASAGNGSVVFSTTDTALIYSDGSNWRLVSDDSIT
jgi:hypothetical protein